DQRIGRPFLLSRDAQVEHSGFDHIQNVARERHGRKQRTEVVTVDEHASDLDEGVQKARLRRFWPWLLQQVIRGVGMCIQRDRTNELACPQQALEGRALGLLDSATEDDEQIDITGVGGAVVTNSGSVAEAPAKIA